MIRNAQSEAMTASLQGNKTTINKSNDPCYYDSI